MVFAWFTGFSITCLVEINTTRVTPDNVNVTRGYTCAKLSKLVRGKSNVAVYLCYCASQFYPTLTLMAINVDVTCDRELIFSI